MNLQDACESFLSHCRSAISLSEHTLRAYAFDLLDFQNHAKRDTDLVSLDKENLRQFTYLRSVQNRLVTAEQLSSRSLAATAWWFANLLTCRKNPERRLARGRIYRFSCAE